MTRPLTTPYHIGDRVRMLERTDDDEAGRCRKGEVGTIQSIFIAAPNDGDETFLLFDVKVQRGTVCRWARAFKPARTRRQLSTLDTKETA